MHVLKLKTIKAYINEDSLYHKVTLLLLKQNLFHLTKQSPKWNEKMLA